MLEHVTDPLPADRPLHGLRVIEVSSFVAAPLGGMTLAQLGAEVIRVDPLGGAADRTRWPLAPSGASLYWAGLNKGKRSVTVDMRSPRGQELVVRLVTGSGQGGGILLTNAATREWLGYDRLSAARSDTIMIQLQGHHDGRPAVDYTVNAETGFPLITGPEGYDGAVNHVLPAWDVACGLYAAVGILAAERRRRLTGAGGQVTLALRDVALATAGNLGLLAEAQLTGDERKRIGNHLYGGFACDFRTADRRRVMVVALTRRHWRDLLRVTGFTGALTEIGRALGADLDTDAGRFEHRETIASVLRPWFRRRSIDEVEKTLAESSVLWSRYRTFTDLVSAAGQAEFAANPMITEIDQPGIGPHLAPSSPLRFPGLPEPAAPAPALGADTDAVLAGLLGIDAAELASLRDGGVLARQT